MVSPLGSDPPKVFLLFYQSYNTLSIFRVCFGLPSTLVLHMKAQFLQFLTLSFYYLGLSSALKAPNQLVWLLLKNCQCLTFICAIIYLLLRYYSSAWLGFTPSLMSQEPLKRLLLLLFNVRLSQLNLLIITSRCIYKRIKTYFIN